MIQQQHIHYLPIPHQFTIIQLQEQEHKLILGLQAWLIVLQHAMMILLFVPFFKVQDLTMVRHQKSRPVRSIMDISQGWEDAISFLQPQGNMKLHLPLTSIHSVRATLCQDLLQETSVNMAVYLFLAFSALFGTFQRFSWLFAIV